MQFEMAMENEENCPDNRKKTEWRVERVDVWDQDLDQDQSHVMIDETFVSIAEKNTKTEWQL